LSAYRFCRTDDIALLVDAWNRCGLPHFPGAAALTVAQFKQEIREIDLWCSSCMVAFDGKDPVGVMIGCKRPPNTLVHRIAVHPDHLRKGHGRHMLTSLSAKLAILGPPTLVAEIPAGNASARALFSACGWRDARTYTDYVAESLAGSPAPPGLVVPVTVADLEDIALPAADAPVAWERSRATLLARAERLKGLAIAPGDRLDAAVLYSVEEDGSVAVWCVYAAGDSAGRDAVAVVMRDVAHRAGGPVSVPRVAATELSRDALDALGLVSGAIVVAVETAARAA